jgi:hypothetical protein
MTLLKAAEALTEINNAALRAASRDLAVERGMAREMAQRSGPGTAPPAPKPAPAYVAPPPAQAAPGAPPPVGWNSRRSTSMAALDAARREREGRGGRS